MRILAPRRAPAVDGTRMAPDPKEKQPKTLIARFCMAVLLVAVALSLAAEQRAASAAHRPPPGTQAAGPNAAASGQPNAAEEAASVVHHGDGVAAIVNDSVISDYDLRQRMALFLATSGARPNQEQLESIRDQVLKQLETDRMEILEAQKNNVAVSASDVDKAIDNIVKDNNLTMDQLKTMLSSSGVDMATLRAQISTQIAWSKLVQDALGDRVHITPEEVDAEYARIKQGANKPRFHVAEIFEAVDSPEQDAKVQKDMADLKAQVEQGAPFSAVARQFSQNPMAAQGGDLGWVQDGQLPPELDAALKTMHPGDLSQPIRSTGGYYLLYYRERQEPAGTKIPDASQQSTTTPAGTLPLARVLLPIGPKPAKDLAERAMQAAAVMRSHMAGCDHLQQLVAKMPGSVYMNLGTMNLKQLSTEMQTALAKTQAGEPTEPFSSAAGIEIIVRCDKPVPKLSVIAIPTKDQIEQQLYEAQIEVQARRYLRDLRREADVETR